jgi:primosomal protein N' (replication factor Y)
MRQALQFPPFTRLIRLVLRGKDEDKVREGSQELARLARKFCPPTAQVLGPVECAMAAVAGNRRWQVILRGTDFPRLHHAAAKAAQGFSASAVYLEIDADPLNML